MGGPKPIFAWGKSCRTAVARTWADECRNTSSACGSLSVRIATFAPSGRGRARSQTLPFTRTASAAFASPGPIALARSAPLEPSGRRFALPSGSVTWISAATIGGSGRGLSGGGTGGTGERRQPAPVAEIERDGEDDHRRNRDPARQASRGQLGRFLRHGSEFYHQPPLTSTNLHQPPPTCLL